jgi:hypothetical protein
MTTIAAFALLSLIITVIPGPDSLLELPLSAVARRRGYDSEFAFARAFKRVCCGPRAGQRPMTAAPRQAAAPRDSA